MQSHAIQLLKPRIVNVRDVGTNIAKITIEPLDRGFGHTLGKPIGYGYVRNGGGVTDEFITEGSYELEVATEIIPCSVHLGPLYDPEMSRIRC